MPFSESKLKFTINYVSKDRQIHKTIVFLNLEKLIKKLTTIWRLVNSRIKKSDKGCKICKEQSQCLERKDNKTS